MTPTPRPALRSLAAASVTALALTLLTAPPATAADAPLVESEPNDTPEQADGPVPAGGFVTTRSSAGDHDRFVLRLQPQRQVTLTLRRGAGCGASPGTNPSNFSLVRSDGAPEVTFNGWAGSGGTVTSTWTTPAIAAEYRGDVFGSTWNGTPCTVTVQVTPADAVITGALPRPVSRRPAVRTGDVAAGRATTATVRGTAVAGDTLVTWWGSRKDTCRSVGAAPVRTALPTGSYRLPVQLPPHRAGRATVCALVTSPAKSLLPDAVRAHRVAVRPQRALRVSRKDVRLGRDRYVRVKTRCALPSGETCVSVVKAATSTASSLGTVKVKVKAGQRSVVRFRLSHRQARRLQHAGVLRVDVRATVTRAGKHRIKEPRTRLLLLPPR